MVNGGEQHMKQVASLNTHILLLLPVPKSIMMCLFLYKSQFTHCLQDPLSVPVEEHDRTRVIQLVHLPIPRPAPSIQSQPLCLFLNNTTHLVEIRHLCNIYEVDHRKILHLL